MKSFQERFWSKVDIKSDEECWEYKARKNKKNYGVFDVSGKSVLAHRVAWELHYRQKIPEGMLILHHCDNPSCVNHHHLYCGTPKDNMQDRTIRGRAAGINSAHGLLKISPEKIKQIKKLRKVAKLSYEKIAGIVGVGYTTVWNYANEKDACHD